MTLAEELIAHVRDTAAPDKARILRTRQLAAELARDIGDPAAAKALVQRLNNAYLVLQLAALSDDPATTRRLRADCVALARALDRARSADPAAPRARVPSRSGSLAG